MREFFGILNLIGFALMAIAYLPQYYTLWKKKRSDQINLLYSYS